jgi:hypothetical protein
MRLLMISFLLLFYSKASALNLCAAPDMFFGDMYMAGGWQVCFTRDGSPASPSRNTIKGDAKCLPADKHFPKYMVNLANNQAISGYISARRLGQQLGQCG